MPLGCKRDVMIAPQGVAQAVGLIDRGLARRLLLGLGHSRRPAAPPRQGRSGPPPATPRTRTAAYFDDQKTAPGSTPARPRREPRASAPPGRCGSARTAAAVAANAGQRRGEGPPELFAVDPAAPDQQQPADRPAGREREDDRRGLPAVAIDRPRLAHMAQPQALDLGRYALEALQAVRPHQGVERGDDQSRDQGKHQPPLPVRGRQPGEPEQQARRRASASDSHTGDKASQTASRLASEAKIRKASAVPAARA